MYDLYSSSDSLPSFYQAFVDNNKFTNISCHFSIFSCKTLNILYGLKKLSALNLDHSFIFFVSWYTKFGGYLMQRPSVRKNSCRTI